MESNLSDHIISLYKKGYSIDYIVNQLFSFKKHQNKNFCNCYYCKKYNGTLKKSDIKNDVYKIIYYNNKTQKLSTGKPALSKQPV